MTQPLSPTPLKFILRLGLIIQDLHGLPDADYAASKPSALRAFKSVRRMSAEDEVKKRLKEDREGAWSLLSACVDSANLNSTPISLSDIAQARIEDTEWDQDGIKNLGIAWFLMKAVDSMKSPSSVPV